MRVLWLAHFAKTLLNASQFVELEELMMMEGSESGTQVGRSRGGGLQGGGKKSCVFRCMRVQRLLGGDIPFWVDLKLDGDKVVVRDDEKDLATVIIRVEAGGDYCLLSRLTRGTFIAFLC